MTSTAPTMALPYRFQIFSNRSRRRSSSTSRKISLIWLYPVRQRLPVLMRAGWAGYQTALWRSRRQNARQYSPAISVRLFPFDRTAHAGNLLRQPLPRRGDSHHGVEQLTLRVRHWLHAGSIESAVVLKPQIRIEAEEIRCADGVVGTRDALGFVQQIGERQAVLGSEPLHVVEVIVRIALSIVRHDGDGFDAMRLELAAVAHDSIDHRLHIGAVIADEHDERAVRSPHVGKTPGPAVGTRQAEIHRFPSKIAGR